MCPCLSSAASYFHLFSYSTSEITDPINISVFPMASMVATAGTQIRENTLRCFCVTRHFEAICFQFYLEQSLWLVPLCFLSHLIEELHGMKDKTGNKLDLSSERNKLGFKVKSKCLNCILNFSPGAPPPCLWRMHSKLPSRCLQSQLVSSTIYTMYYPLHTYL